MELQEIEVDRLNEIVLMKAGLGVPLKFSYIGIQPDRDAEIKMNTQLI